LRIPYKLSIATKYEKKPLFLALVIMCL